MSRIRKSLLYLLLALLLCQTGIAQDRCYECNSQRGVRRVRFGKKVQTLCGRCAILAQNCHFCRRKGQPELLRDGRRICRRCKGSLILTQEQLDKLYDGVKAYLKRDKAGILLKNPPPVTIADKDEIQTKFIESGRSLDVAGFYQPYNPESIFILSGKSRDTCSSTIVHEYTHAWQSRNCPSQDRALVEGFATWIQYRYLVSKGRRREAYNLTRHHDPDYGASLKRLLELEKKVGVSGVVEYAKTEKELPR